MKMGLGRDEIVRSALDLLNEVGLDAFTTRRLAERLGVKQPAIYWHFKNKRDLLDEMAAQMMKEGVPPGPMTPDTWIETLKDNARNFRDSLLRYRDGARVHAGTRPDASLYASLDSRVRAMRDAGFSADDAVRAMMVMSHYVVGSVIEEQSGAEAARVSIDSGFVPDADTYPDLSYGISQMLDDDATDGFEFGLDALVRGLAASRPA